MGHDHRHDHGHATAAGRSRGRLLAVLAVSALVLVVEVVGALVSGSLALLADAGHVLTDVVGVGAALVAVELARRPATPERTFGLVRAEVLAAAANAALLGVVGAYVLVEGVRRLASPPQVDAPVMAAVAAVGLLGNLVSVGLLARDRSASLTVRGAFLEVATDAAASAGVLLAALVTAVTGWDRADAVAAVVLGAVVLPRAWRLLREAVDVLLEATPRDVDLAEVRAHLLGVERVEDVHDLHAWTLTSGLPVLSAHVVVEPGCFADGGAPQVLDALQSCLAGHFDVEHSTFQLEPAGHDDHEGSTHA